MKRFLCWPLITALALVTGCSGSNNDGYQAGIKCALDGPGDIDSPRAMKQPIGCPEPAWI